MRPGGTVWLRGGTYFVGTLESTLAGTQQAPIVVRSMPGEHAILDGAGAVGAALTVNGPWTVFRDFEVTSSDPVRSGDQLKRPTGVDVHGANVIVANLVVHDLGGGFGIWADAVDAEAYGNIIYYNGWVGSERPHGHGIYTQSKTGVRRLTDNVIFGQFGIGIHAYASEQGFLDDMRLEGNVVFNNGVTASDFNILVGGHRLAHRPVLRANFTYDNPGAGSNVGYEAGCLDAEIKDNYLVSVRGGYAVQLVNCTGRLYDNVLVGQIRSVMGGTIVTRPAMAAEHPRNDFELQPPAVTRTFVRPNRFAPGRAHVIVYNWEHTSEVQVNLAPAGLLMGTAYEIRDVRNLAAPAVVTGRYTGQPVTIPLGQLTVAPMVGWQPAPPHSAPEFAVFIVTPAPAEPSLSTQVLRLLGR